MHASEEGELAIEYYIFPGIDNLCMQPGWWEETLMSFQAERGISVEGYLPWIKAYIALWRPLLARCWTATDLYFIIYYLFFTLKLFFN